MFCPVKFHSGKESYRGNNINKDVPILVLIEPNKPKIVNNGTIKISAPPPTTPALNPLSIPIMVKPK